MKQANSKAKSSTKRVNTNNSKKKEQTSAHKENIIQNSHEEKILNLWEKRNVYKVDEKTTELPTYVIREMPTPVHRLSIDSLRRKIYQDIFLKYEMLHGNTVSYSPLWETFPFSIESSVIKENKATTSGNIINFRKKCRQLYSDHLKSQQQKFKNLGIFADWSSSDKTLEARHETKLFSFFDRLRDSNYLRDELKLSHWCPQCVAPLEIGKTVNPISTDIDYTFVKFPFNNGFEEFGKDVYFAVRFPVTNIWEIAGTIGLGIYENTNFYLTESKDQYVIFSEPQLKKYVDPNAKRKKYPEPLAKLDANQLSKYLVSHPLFSLSELPFVTIPTDIIDTITDSSERNELIDGIIPINPAHHSLSYSLYNRLPDIRNSLNTKHLTSTTMTPIFDENGRFTEDAETLCGLNLMNALQFITDELESRGFIMTAGNNKTEQLQCQHCHGLSVLRPYRHWTFATNSDGITDEISTSPEYWDHYHDSIREDIQNEMLHVSDMQISSQRQWGIPLPVLRCDNCNNLINDKKILRAVRGAIRRGSEHWFRLSVEELLPTDAVCMNCHSKDFRKESTYIESNFANLLQTLDTSDFKKSTIDTAINVSFAPRNAFLKWLGELSVLSISLQLSRPSKESHPFKQLKLHEIEDAVWEVEVQDYILQKYPADVIRLIGISPDLYQVQLDRDGAQQLENLVEKHNKKYTQLKEILYKIYKLLSEIKTKKNANKQNIFSINPKKQFYEKLPEQDSYAIALTNQLLNNYDVAYEKRDFFNMWQLLYEFCKTDLNYYFGICQTDATESAIITLTVIFKILIQRISPILPYLAEEIFAEELSSKRSIFEEKWTFLPQIAIHNDTNSKQNR
ncbi:MAG: class I tRNA ligase family protein [Candidatus Poribacteria bacterium]|nr:class I tRNA ligase family protein [Candidatus Poribacteria bacterium]